MKYKDLTDLIEKIDKETDFRHHAFFKTYGYEWKSTFKKLKDTEKKYVFNRIKGLYQVFDKKHEDMLIWRLLCFRKNYTRGFLN